MPQIELVQLQLSASQLVELQALLQRHLPHSEVWAYGSRVTGLAHEGSDLDLVLRHPLDLSLDVEGWDEFTYAVQDSNLPMLIDIHLWSRLPSSFHREIEKAYVVLQQADL
jgi:Predicted nucleotidyltransferases